MSHFTALVTIPASAATNIEDARDALELILEPYNENADVPPYRMDVDAEDIRIAVRAFREEPGVKRNVNVPPPPALLVSATKGDDDETIVNMPRISDDSNAWLRTALERVVGTPILTDLDGGLWYWSTFNQNGQWDWWVLGGRWHGSMHVKDGVTVGAESLPEFMNQIPGEGVQGALTIPLWDGHDALLGGSGVMGDDPSENFTGRADLVRRGDVDLDGMRTLAALAAERHYDEFEKAVEGLVVPPPWMEFLNQHAKQEGMEGVDDLWSSSTPGEVRSSIMDAARHLYRTFEWVSVARRYTGLLADPHETFFVGQENPRERFIEEARNSALSASAIVHEGNWIGRGQMGWFGMGHNEESGETWTKKVNDLIAGLPDDTYLAIVDCHA